MVLGSVIAIRHREPSLGVSDAYRIARQAWRFARPKLVLLDLRRTTEATTAALARLVLLRRRLLNSGRDLRIMGLGGRADALYRMTRMEKLLPRTRPRRREGGPCAGQGHHSQPARYRPAERATATAADAPA